MKGKKYINDNFPHFLHGADYNPEQWKDYPDVLREDMRLMKAAGMNEMTLGVFSWAEIEREEGVFDFTFLDRAFDMIEEAGGKIILATPSGSRPRWLSEKYPEVLRTTPERQKRLYGTRHNHCYTSPIFREKVAIINKKLAQRYGHRPSLYAFHVSNEVNGECHCEYCRAAFVEWCRKKYEGDIEKLNREWWSIFWSHRYNSFEQIEPPSPLGDRTIQALTLDWRRFCTDQTVDFLLHEQKALREFAPHIPTTTNLMGTLYLGLDLRKIAESVDFVSWDNYPEWASPVGDIRRGIETAFAHDFMRGTGGGENFLLMESTPSLVNWKEINKLKRPRMLLLSSLQAVAHGSDSVQYFQFRKSRGSVEKHHGAVVDHVGHENTRVFRDVAEVGRVLSDIDEVCGSRVKSEVAIVFDIENLWGLEMIQGMQKKDKKYTETCFDHYAPLWRRGINADVISRHDDFEKYKVVIAPMLYMCEESVIKRIADYVHGGGVFISTYTFSQVNENDLCHLGGFPGGELKDVFGIWAEELDTLYPDERNYIKADGKTYEAKDYCELVHLRGADALATYDSDFYRGMPAATVNTWGKGKAYYISFRDARGDFLSSLYERVLRECGVVGGISDGCSELPEGVSAHTRVWEDARYVFVECFNSEGAYVKLDGEYYSMLDKKYVDELSFEGLGVAVLKAR